MKKITLSLIAALSLGIASCSMEKNPYNAIDESKALESVNDFKNLRIGLYSGLRILTSGSYVTLSEIQCDNFNAVVGYSNTNGDIHRWQFTSNTSDFASIYSNYQALIARANFILTNQGQLNKENLDEKDLAFVNKVLGEAYFMRAYCIFQLAQYFCNAYDEQTASKPNSGVSYSLKYAPSADPSTYPGRKTLKETYTQIGLDIEQAKALIDVEGEAASSYITNDVITALEARIALAQKKYKEAAELAVSVINTGNYALCSDADAIKAMWHDDGTGETILQIPIPSKNELCGQNGRRFLPYQNGSVPDYIPTKEFIQLFDAKDYRLASYFTNYNMSTTSGASGVAVLFNKYTDHSALWDALGQSEDGRFMSEPKPFRIAEMYLIAAEGYAMAETPNQELATKYLNDLKSNRIADYTETQFASINSLMSEIKNERRRELACEGFRLLDLKRWNEGVVRGEPQNIDFCLFPGSANTTALKKSASDPRMTWPIPLTEMDTNPQMYQNDGY
jgi:hypothetical protein